MAVVLSGVSIAWFGWGQQGGRLTGVLQAGMLLSAVVLIVAIVMVRRVPAPPTLATDRTARKIYWVSVVAEVLAILVGVVLLGTTGHGAYLPAWTLIVVGLHFVPFVGIFKAPILRLATVLCLLVGAASVILGLTGVVPAPTVAGIGGGVGLLGIALAALRVAGPEDAGRRRPEQVGSVPSGPPRLTPWQD